MKSQRSSRLVLFVAAVAATVASTSASAASAACPCKHYSAICMGKDVGGKDICLYVVNVLNRELTYVERGFGKAPDGADCEKEFVDFVVETPTLPDHRDNHTRFLQPHSSRVEDERLSADGLVVLRAFCGGTNCKEDVLTDVKLELNGKPIEMVGDGAPSRVASMSERLSTASLGDPLEFRLSSKAFPNAAATRNSWFRPRDEWVIDYSILGLAFAWPSWKIRGQPETAAVPALMEVTYRWYKPNGKAFIFSSFGFGPNVVLAKAEVGDENKSGNKVINGMVGAATLNVNGFKFGFGTRWSWLEGRFDPMIILSVTDAVARGLKLTDNAPAGLVSLTK